MYQRISILNACNLTGIDLDVREGEAHISFQSAVMAKYRSPKACIQINNTDSETFMLEKRHKARLSPFASIICPGDGAIYPGCKRQQKNTLLFFSIFIVFRISWREIGLSKNSLCCSDRVFGKGYLLKNFSIKLPRGFVEVYRSCKNPQNCL